jgi:hypothetical protein
VQVWKDIFVQEEATTRLTHIYKGELCVGTTTLFNNDFPVNGNGAITEKKTVGMLCKPI